MSHRISVRRIEAAARSPGALGFAKANQSAGLDVGTVNPSDLRAIIAAGLRIGTVDLNNHTAMVSADARKHKATAQHLRVCPSMAYQSRKCNKQQQLHISTLEQATSCMKTVYHPVKR